MKSTTKSYFFFMRPMIIILKIFILAVTSCHPSKSIDNSINSNAYQRLSPELDWLQFVGKKVQMRVKICEMEMQHIRLANLGLLRRNAAKFYFVQ